MDCDEVVESCDLLANSDSEVDLETVGVTGDVVSLIGDVGESRSLEPDESFVLFFFKNPRVGIEAALKECTSPSLPRCRSKPRAWPILIVEFAGAKY